MGRARRSRSGARRGRNGSSSSPRARAWIRAPSSPNRATSAVRASSATAPIRRRPNRVSRARTSGSGVSRPDGCGARKPASPPGGTTIGRAGPGEDGGDGRREPGPGDARPGCSPAPRRRARAPSASDQPLDEDRLGAPQRLEAVDLDLEQPERGIGRVGAPGDPRAERRERLEGGLDGRPVRVGIRIDEGRLRNEPMGAPERHPPPDAQRPGLRVRVDDRARIPRPAAQDERAGREGLGGSRPGELEGEVWPVEMEQSHRGGPFGGSRGLDRGLRRGGGRPGGGRHRARRPPRRGSGGSPAAPAGRSGCGRPAPPSAGRRCRARGGSTTAGRAPAGGWSTRRRPSARPPARPGGSSTTSSVSARRARAASRPSRSAMPAGRSVAASRPPGRSRTSRSTERPASSMPPMASPSSSVSGVMTTSHSSRTPRATASTGSKLRARSSQATIAPVAWASAASRRTSVVRPLEPSPRMATLADRGRPPGPRIASSAANPVWTTRSSAAGDGLGQWPVLGELAPGVRAGSGGQRERPDDLAELRLPSEPGGSPRRPSTSAERDSPSDTRLEHLVLVESRPFAQQMALSIGISRPPSPARHAGA